jgi:hypothetical protein
LILTIPIVLLLTMAAPEELPVDPAVMLPVVIHVPANAALTTSP